MESLKDRRRLSLNLLLASIRDLEAIHSVSLPQDAEFLRKLYREVEFPEVHLATLGKAMETSLITGRKLQCDVSIFPHLDGTNLPSFLYFYFSSLFCEDGTPRYILGANQRLPYGKPQFNLVSHGEEITDVRMSAIPRIPCIKDAAATLQGLRQVLMLFSKAEDIPCLGNTDQELASFKTRLLCSDFPDKNRMRYKPGLSIVFSIARKLLRELLQDGDEPRAEFAQWDSNPFGRHGPGAVADRSSGPDKWSFMIQDCMRLPRMLYSDSYGASLESSTRTTGYSSRVCVVPKDFRGHRIICIEPKELQYAQQGLLKVITDLVHRSLLTREHIDFRHQELSASLSRGLGYGTIDLKDASDCITKRLASILFPEWFYKLVMSVRSDSIVFPDGSVVGPYETAFTMGNALCFPLETLIFWSLTAAAIYTEGGNSIPMTQTSDWVTRIPMRVFGDDIVVPISQTTIVMDCLESAGLVVNRQKSCDCSLVREACGSWWFAGWDCRITKLKFARTLDFASWVSFQAVIPTLRDSGYIELAAMLDLLSRSVYPTIDQVNDMGSFGTRDLLRFRGKKIWRFNKSLQRSEFRTPVLKDTETQPLPQRQALTAWWCNSATRFWSPHAQRVKFQWVSVER